LRPGGFVAGDKKRSASDGLTILWQPMEGIDGRESNTQGEGGQYPKNQERKRFQIGKHAKPNEVVHQIKRIKTRAVDDTEK